MNNPNKPKSFDECFYGKEWTKAIVEPFDYEYIIFVGRSRDQCYNHYIAKVNLSKAGTIYRTKINKLEDIRE